MIWPVVAYAPNAATKPSIAAQPLNFSASGDIVVFEICIKYKERIDVSWVYTYSFWLLDLILFIRKAYLIIELICVECIFFVLPFFCSQVSILKPEHS